MTPRQTSGFPPAVAPSSIRVVEHEWIPVSDGVRLAARLWLPAGAGATRPVSVILDSVPYRLGDGTAVGDGAWGTYFAAHGLAFARVDIRGSGNAGGVLVDEYTEQEQRDCDEVIAWLAAQPWCSGSVGMIGVSWGGFAALQMAARGPAALHGVVAIHASDDRYADDVHYVGGCVSAMDITQWATSMLAYLSQPPDPRVVGEAWRDLWRARLEGARPFTETWLSHQRRDGYWRQGSACEAYSAIRCPVFAVGGWSDGYRDMVLRVVENVAAPVRGLIGPWGHSRPERGVPGPAIGFLQECVRFFAAALDGAGNGFFDEPKLISYLQEPVAPAGSYPERAGRWVADPSWPSPNVRPWTLALGGDGRLRAAGGAAVAAGEVRVRSPQTTGIDGGVWCGDGGPSDFGSDQRTDDGGSACWDTEPLSDRLELLGRAEARLVVTVDRPQALVAVRVCDVAPDGTSTLVARGLLNLSRRQGQDASVPMPVGEPVAVRVPLQSTGYAVPPGHWIRVAVSSAYWPMAWPPPEPVTLAVRCGPDSVITLPCRHPGPLDETLRPFGPPESGEAPASETMMRRGGGRRVTRDLGTGETEVVFDWHPSAVRLLSTGTEMGEENITTYRIVEGDPLSARVVCRVVVTLRRPGWTTRADATSTMTCDRESFTVTTAHDVYEDETRVFARTHTHVFARDGA